MLRLRPVYYFLIFLFITTAVYFNSLNNPFMMDDDYLIVQDTKLHNIKYWYYQFIPDLNKHLNLDYKESSAYYRPFAHILPMIGYCLFQEHVFGYHVMNLLLFVFAGFCIFLLLNRLIRNEITAFLTTILFLVHPLNGLFVNYITASVFAAQLIFITLSIWLLLDAVNQKSSLAYILSMVMALGALFCHETSLVVSGYMLLILWINQRKSFRTSLKIVVPFVLLAAGFFIFRLFFASLQTSILSKTSALGMNIFEYIATFTKLVGWYVSKIFLPDGIVIIWSTAILRSNLFVWNLIFILVAAGLVYLLRMKDKYSDIVLGAAIFVMGLLPVGYACLFQPANGLMMEPHWLFFPSIGLFLIFVTILQSVEKMVFSKGGYIIISLFIGISSLYTHRFNEVWADEREYCRYWIQQVPHFKSTYFYLANAYMKHDQNELARENFFKALEGRYNDWQIYNNLALIDQKNGNVHDAIEHYQQALTVSPKSVTVNNNVGLLLSKQGKTEEAKNYFISAIQSNRFFLEPRLNLAYIYREEKEFDQAEKLYQDNLNINPAHHTTLVDLMGLYLSSNNKSGIENVSEMVFKNPKPDLILLVDLGGTSARYRHFPLAEAFYLQAVQLYPRAALPYRELGKLYANTSRKEKALDAWHQALAITPNDQDVLEWIRELNR